MPRAYPQSRAVGRRSRGWRTGLGWRARLARKSLRADSFRQRYPRPRCSKSASGRARPSCIPAERPVQATLSKPQSRTRAEAGTGARGRRRRPSWAEHYPPSESQASSAMVTGPERHRAVVGSPRTILPSRAAPASVEHGCEVHALLLPRSPSFSATPWLSAQKLGAERYATTFSAAKAPSPFPGQAARVKLSKGRAPALPDPKTPRRVTWAEDAAIPPSARRVGGPAVEGWLALGRRPVLGMHLMSG